MPQLQPSINQVHIDGPMTNVSIAYRNMNYIAAQIFPTVPVNKMSDEYFVFDKADWFRNEAGPRAPATRGPEGGYALSSCAYSCRPVSFTKVVPDEVVDNADDPLKPRVEAVEFATDKIMLYQEVDVSGYVFADSVWSGSAEPGTKWEDDTSDPVGDVEIARETIVKNIGREPNVCVIGRAVWTALKKHPDLLDRIKYTQTGILSESLLATLFEVPKLLIGNAVYTSQKEGEADITYSFVWGKYCWFGWVPPSPGLMTPAAGYVLTYENRRVLNFRREEELATAFRCQASYDAVVTAGDAGYILKSVVT